MLLSSTLLIEMAFSVSGPFPAFFASIVSVSMYEEPYYLPADLNLMKKLQVSPTRSSMAVLPSSSAISAFRTTIWQRSIPRSGAEVNIGIGAITGE